MCYYFTQHCATRPQSIVRNQSSPRARDEFFSHGTPPPLPPSHVYINEITKYSITLTKAQRCRRLYNIVYSAYNAMRARVHILTTNLLSIAVQYKLCLMMVKFKIIKHYNNLIKQINTRTFYGTWMFFPLRNIKNNEKLFL